MTYFPKLLIGHKILNIKRKTIAAVNWSNQNRLQKRKFGAW